MDGTRYRRPALGDRASVGTLYDFRSDSFLETSIWNTVNHGESAILSTESDGTESQFQYVIPDNYSEKFTKLNMNSSLKLSILSGIYEFEGADAKYLPGVPQSSKCFKSTLLYSWPTLDQELNFFSKDLKKWISDPDLFPARATHILIGIQWGSQIFISFECESDNIFKKEIQEEFVRQCDKIKKYVSEGAQMDSTNKVKFKYKIFDDINPADITITTSILEVVQFLKSIPEKVKKVNNGTGQPLHYILLPIRHTCNLIGLEYTGTTTVGIPQREIDFEIVNKIVKIFDDILETKRRLIDFNNEISGYKLYLSKEDGSRPDDFGIELNDLEMCLKSELKSALGKFRRGEVKENVVDDIYGQLFPKLKDLINKLKKTEENLKDKISLIEMLLKEGAEAIGFGTNSYVNVVMSKQKSYILYFDESTKNLNKDLWEANLEHFRKLLEKNIEKAEDEIGRAKFYFIINQDVTKLPVPVQNICIKLYKNKKTLSEDVLEDYDKRKNDPFVGTYELVEDGGFKAKFIKVGLDLGGQSKKWLGWYLAMTSSNTIIITETDGTYLIQGENGQLPLQFELDEEFKEHTADGYEAQSKVKRELNSLIHKQTLTMKDGKKTERIIFREFTDQGMKVTRTANGSSARSVYTRVIEE